MARRRLSCADEIKRQLYFARKKKDIFCVAELPVAQVNGTTEQRLEILQEYITFGNEYGYQVWLFELDKPDTIIIRYMDMRINMNDEMREFLYAKIDNGSVRNSSDAKSRRTVQKVRKRKTADKSNRGHTKTA